MKKIFKKILEHLGLSVVSKSLLEMSDDPLHALTNIFQKDEVKIIVDCGASIGETSDLYSKNFKNACVYAYEPLPNFYNLLHQKSLKNNRIIPFELALSNSCGSNTFSVNLSSGTSSLLKSNKIKSSTYGQLTTPQEKLKVKTQTLDSLFQNETIDVLKLDIQGGEFNALCGAEKILNENRLKAIVCEVMFERHYEKQVSGTKLMSFIEEKNFFVFNLYQIHYHHGRIVQADILFIHNSLIKKIDASIIQNFLPLSKYLKNH